MWSPVQIRLSLPPTHPHTPLLQCWTLEHTQTHVSRARATTENCALTHVALWINFKHTDAILQTRCTGWTYHAHTLQSRCRLPVISVEYFNFLQPAQQLQATLMASKERRPVFPQRVESLSHVCSAVYVASCPRLLRALRPDPGRQAHLSPAAEN